MDYIVTTLENLVHQTAFFNLEFGNYMMIIVACVFLYLAIAKGFEPLLLTPIAFGMLLVNIYPDIMMSIEESANGAGGLLYYFYLLDEWAILPSLIFMGVGAMTDFGPLIANPISLLLGAAAQFGIYVAFTLANFLGNSIIIGGEPMFTAAQAADELLNIIGIDASFVISPDGERVNISGRSMGDTNVQLILEKLGGGGNAAAAGGQIADKTVDEVAQELARAIDQYLEEE